MIRQYSDDSSIEVIGTIVPTFQRNQEEMKAIAPEVDKFGMACL